MNSTDKFRLVFSVLLIWCLAGSVAYSFLKPVMMGEGECVDDDWEVHPIGSMWYDAENCEKLECVLHKNVLYAKGYGCSSIGIPSGCKLVPGKGVRYPNCCPKVKCPKKGRG